MNRVKSDWRNRLGEARLECALRISEDGPDLNKFNPDPPISVWLEDRNSSSHNYPTQRKKVGDSSSSSSAVGIIRLHEIDSSD